LERCPFVLGNQIDSPGRVSLVQPAMELVRRCLIEQARPRIQIGAIAVGFRCMAAAIPILDRVVKDLEFRAAGRG